MWARPGGSLGLNLSGTIVYRWLVLEGLWAESVGYIGGSSWRDSGAESIGHIGGGPGGGGRCHFKFLQPHSEGWGNTGKIPSPIKSITKSVSFELYGTVFENDAWNL